jgi:hypothetical protein
VNVHGSLASQALGALPGKAEIMQACASLGAWARWMKIVDACGSLAWQALGPRSCRDCAGLKGGSLGDRGPGRAEEQTQGSRILWPSKWQICRPVGRGWHAVPAVLLVNRGSLKPSTH